MIKKIDAGKFSIKTVFKSKDGKAKKATELQEKNEQLGRDVENWIYLKKFLTVYLYEKAIPYHKEFNIKKYVRAILLFSHDETENSKVHISCWTDFNNHINGLIQKVGQDN